MATGSKGDNSTLKFGWVSMDGGYEVTQSPGIIHKHIKLLKTGRMMITLLTKGYQSGSTVLFEFDDQFIFIDKPKDWTPDKNKFRVVFRNEAKVWMHFVTMVREVQDDSLKCFMPRELFMLQRRNHYRVLLPSKSHVRFVYDNEECEFQVKDLSAGGMLMFSPYDTEIPQHGNHLKNLELSVPCDDRIPGVENGLFTVTIEEADVVREFVQDQHPTLFCFGVRFFLTDAEEEKILRYVRQRELEVLRKGLTG